MKVIVKTLVVIFMILLTIILISMIPVRFVFAIRDRIRYGINIPNILSGMVDAIKDLCGSIPKIISL